MTLSPQDFVQSLYRGILGREPDPVGLASHVHDLGGAVTAEAAARMIQEFVSSEEFRSRRVFLEDFTITPRSNGAAFAHAASLGSVCWPAMMFKQMGLRRYALPFDWIFSSLDMVEHCIGDDFATLTDARHFRLNPVEQRRRPDEGYASHAVYGAEYGIHTMFNHYDPTDPRRHAYLLRCVERFRRLLASDAPKLFLASVPTPRAPMLATSFGRLADTLDRVTHNATLLVLGVVPPRTGQGILGTQRIEERGRHRLLRCGR